MWHLSALLGTRTNRPQGSRPSYGGGAPSGYGGDGGYGGGDGGYGGYAPPRMSFFLYIFLRSIRPD